MGAHRPRQVDGCLGRCRQRQDDQPGGTGRRADGNARRAAEPTGGDHVHREGSTRSFASAARSARQLGVTRRSVHRHHSRVLPIAAPALSDRGRPAPQVHDGRRADLRSHGRRARRTGGADALQPGAEEAGNRRGVDGDRLVRCDAVPPRAGEGDRQRLAALRRLDTRTSDVDRGCPLDGDAHARQRHVRSAISGGQQRHANEARRGPRRCPLDTGVRRIDSGAFRRRGRDRRTSTRLSRSVGSVRSRVALCQLRAGAQSVDVGADTDRDRVGAHPHQPRRAVVRRSARADPPPAADEARRSPRDSRSASLPVRRRVPRHRSGAVRRHHRADCTRRCQSAVVAVRRWRPEAVDLRVSSRRCRAVLQSAGSRHSQRTTDRSIAAPGPMSASGSMPCSSNDSPRPTTPATTINRLPTPRSIHNATRMRRATGRVWSCSVCRDGRRWSTSTAEDMARAEAADIAALMQRVVRRRSVDGQRQLRRSAGQLSRFHGVDSQSHPPRCARAHLAPGRHPVPRRGRHVDLRIARGVRAAARAAGDR